MQWGRVPPLGLWLWSYDPVLQLANGREKIFGKQWIKTGVAILRGTRCSKLVGMSSAQEASGRRDVGLRGLGFLARFPLWFY